jgi:Tol biopolymer transport system component
VKGLLDRVFASMRAAVSGCGWLIVTTEAKTKVYSAQAGANDVDLWVLPLEGERKPTPYLKTAFFESQGQFSPDGHFAAYSSNSSGKTEVYVQPFPNAQTGRWIVSKGVGIQPAWRRDGRRPVLHFLG